MDQPIDREALGGDRRCDRIDQEGHVVVDYRNPHEAHCRRPGDRFQNEGRIISAPLGGGGNDKFCGAGEALCGKGRVAGEQRIHQTRFKLLGHLGGGRASAGGFQTHRLRSPSSLVAAGPCELLYYCDQQYSCAL